MKYAILSLFVLTYLFIILFTKYKHLTTLFTALVGVILLLISKETTFLEVLLSIDYNVVLMLFGIMLTVGYFADSNMPNRISEKIMKNIHNTRTAIVLLAVLSGVISAFVDNVATVLMLAPIGIAVAKKAKISPVPVIISIAVSSNLQGAATLVGDTTSVMLGGFANMSFFDFFFMEGRPSIFFAVELGALATIPVLTWIFRKDKKQFEFLSEEIKVKTVFPSVMLVLNLLLLVVSSFIRNKPEITNGLICTIIGVICYIYNLIRFKPNPFKTIKEVVDIETVVFLICLFLLIGCVEKVGIISDISNAFTNIGKDNILLLYTIIVFGSVIISAFIDNIPYVATMLPVIQSITLSINAPKNITLLLYFGLLIGATLGGNLTPVGASANVVGLGILNKQGYKTCAKDFFKIGIPFTLVAVLMGYLYTLIVWYVI